MLLLRLIPLFKLFKAANEPITNEELLREMKPVLSKYLKKLGLKPDEIETMWDEIERAVRLIDSQEEFDELIENPEELVDRLVRILASSFMAPLAG